MKALVTGSSAGIGLAVAREFLKNGCQVMGLDIHPAGLEHPGYTHIQTDILTGELPDISDIDILVNNAGVQQSGRDIDVNLKGTMRVTEKYAFHEGIRSVLFMASASARTGAEFPEYRPPVPLRCHGQQPLPRRGAHRPQRPHHRRPRPVGGGAGRDHPPQVGHGGGNRPMDVVCDGGEPLHDGSGPAHRQR